MEADQLLAVIRDMLLILLAITGVLVSVTISVVTLLLYRKVSPIITAAKTTVDQAQETSSIISEKIVRPMVASSTLAHSAGQVVSFIIGLSKGKGEQNNGK